MSSLIDSTAQYESQLRETGIDLALIDGLKRHGVRTLSQLAFAVGQPGQVILDQAVEQLVQNSVGKAATLTEVASLKRVAFEAQTFLTATLRQAVDRSEDSLPRKIPFAERQARMETLKAGLSGLSLTGELEPAHSLLDRVCAMHEANAIKYLDLATCIPRSLEIQGTTKSKELTLERGSLVWKSQEDKVTSATDSEIKVHYALVRRGVAFQFGRIMSFDQHSQWETFLFEALHREAPPGYSRPSLAQLLQCDKAAFSRLATTVGSIRMNDAGEYPLGDALLKLRGDPLIALYLMPSAGPKTGPAQASPSNPRSQPYGQPSNKGKGFGKGKRSGKSSPPVPNELRGKWHRTAAGDPICFGFNCRSGCAEKGIKPGQKCSKGYHICAEPKCGGDHSLQQHPGK